MARICTINRDETRTGPPLEVETVEWEISKTGNLDRWSGVERCGGFARESEMDVILKWSESLQRSGYLADRPG
jgi:hypothetical protein